MSATLKSCPICAQAMRLYASAMGTFMIMHATHSRSCPIICVPYETEVEAVNTWNVRAPQEGPKLVQVAHVDHSCNAGKIIWELDPASIDNYEELFILEQL
jgi:hypothetical protein